MSFVTLDKGQRLDLLSELELRSCTRSCLREHADRVHKALGRKIPAAPANSSDELTDWILSAQRHFEPLRKPDVRDCSIVASRGSEISPRRVRSEADIRKDVDKMSIRDFRCPDERVHPEDSRPEFGRTPMDRGAQPMELYPPDSSTFSLGPDPMDKHGLPTEFGHGVVIGEAHSRQAEQLARRHPVLTAVIARKVQLALRHFHDGVYGGDLELSQQKLADDIYRQLEEDKENFSAFREIFLNLSVAVGAMAYAGNISAFCYKFAYPQRWSCNSAPAWVTVFFTLQERAERNHELEPVREHERETESEYEREREPFDDRLERAARQLACDRERERKREFERQAASDRERERQDGDRQRERLVPERVLPGDAERKLERLQASDRAASERARERDLLAERQRIFGSKSPRGDAHVPMNPMDRELERDLQLLDHGSLCERAEILYRDLGGERCGLRAPNVGDNLVEWVLRAERRRMELVEPEPPRSEQPSVSPRSNDLLRPSARGDVRDVVSADWFSNRVETKTFNDGLGKEIGNRTGTDRYGDDIRTARSALGDEATTHRVKNAFGEKVAARPERSPLDVFGDRLDERLRSVSPRRILDPAARRGDVADMATTDRFRDRVETKQYKDAFGDGVTARMQTDRYGDEMNTPIVQDRYSDEVNMRTVKDKFGDEISTHTMMGRYGDEVATRTVMDRYGDEPLSVLARDPYVDSANKRSKSPRTFGNPPRSATTASDAGASDTLTGRAKTFQERLETASASNSRYLRENPLWQREGRGLS